MIIVFYWKSNTYTHLISIPYFSFNVQLIARTVVS